MNFIRRILCRLFCNRAIIVRMDYPAGSRFMVPDKTCSLPDPGNKETSFAITNAESNATDERIPIYLTTTFFTPTPQGLSVESSTTRLIGYTTNEKPLSQRMKESELRGH